MSKAATKANRDEIATLLDDDPVAAAGAGGAVPAPANVNVSPFDARGRIRDLSGAADTALIAVMPKDQRAIFFQMISDAVEFNAVEDRIGELRTATIKAMNEHERANEANNANNPPLTHQELQAAVLHAHDPDVVPKPKGRRPVNPKPLARLELAHLELIRLREETTQANHDLRRLGRIRGESLKLYMATLPPVTDLDIQRAYQARSGAEALARAKGEIPPAPVAPPPKWPIEAAIATRALAKKTGRQYTGSIAGTKKLGLNYGGR